jgi:8-oxo-dGTP pyrophosphatase MutT (NUDIX family)
MLHFNRNVFSPIADGWGPDSVGNHSLSLGRFVVFRQNGCIYYLTGARRMCYKGRVPDSDTTSFLDAAVIVPVYRDTAGELRLVMIRRTAGGLHGGQLAFPGGRPEPEDDGSLLETAFRETKEEIGLERDRIRILEELPRVDTISTRFRIFPFLSEIDHPGEWRKEPAEVDAVLELGVDALLHPDAVQLGTEHAPNWPQPRQIAYFRVGEDKLWGASFRILQPLLMRLVAGEWTIP